MIAWFARNHVAANLLMICIIASGAYHLIAKIPLEVFPTFEADTISVNVTLRGSTPEDAELSVATRIEEALMDLEGVKELRSRSTEGSAGVTVEVEQGYDPREILDDVKNRVDAINTLPGEAERPIIALAMWKRDVIDVTVSGDVSEKEIRQLAEKVRDDLLRVDGITQVEVAGVRNYEIAIELPQDTLREYDLTLSDVSNAIQQSSIDLSAGNIKTDGGDVLIRSKGQAYRQDEFERIVLKTHSDGTVLTLGDIAQIYDGFEETAIRTRFDGEIAATLSVYRIGNQSAIEVAQKVKDYIQTQQTKLPDGIHLGYWSDDSVVVKKRISTLTTNAIQGGILVLILLGLFLRPAVAFWVFIGIPVSFLGSFMVLSLFGVTLNIISLFGFIVVLGIVVDDAIVTGENVYKHLENAENGLQAAIVGTKEVATPVTFGVLTTVAAFTPLLFIEGNRGAIFAQIPAVVIPVLLFSLIESKFVLPAHLKYLKVRQNQDPATQNKLQQLQQKFATGFEVAILKYYKPVLELSLRNKRSTLVCFSGILGIIIAAIMVGHTKFIFFPRIPGETVEVSVTMPNGTPFEVTDYHIERITQAARELQKEYIDPVTNESVILHILSQTGRGGDAARGQVRFEITPPEELHFPISSQELSRAWRDKVGEIPGAEEVTFRSEIGRSSDPINIQLRGNDFAQLNKVGELVKERLATYPTVFDINDSMANGKEEIQIELKPEAYLLGITRSQVINQVRQAFYGVQAQRIQRGRDDVRVMVRFPRSERNSIANLNNMLINTDEGKQVPLSQVARFVPGKSPTSIYRINGNRVLTVIADLDKEQTNVTVLTQDLRQFLDELIAQYPSVTYMMDGEAREQEESFNSLYWGLAGVFFAIYALLAIPLRSYTIPLIVMSIIPFGIIGAMGGHWLMGMDLTIMSIWGLLALLGVVVNDSLVLVDYIGKKRDEGMSVKDAVLTAGAARFRPVMLTSLTTFIGLMPLLFEKSTQAQFLIPMAVSLGFGIIFATFVTLLLVPVNYLMAYQVRNWWRAI
ncbi:efflux RND transporter permease subunit [Catenovulum sp. 2E275]|uniref:efflux RND transporter permease subunit n=1 Tax=Catenovulum sp. 2E275 TaxID=2980497 RepID=UPI0021D05595|nr:efflux RND transporter permease subunit [Catenovulum sp. 2E275]MCU4675799.1 efflux RND transporter permease subunit [Catenovulum sp. 2E275]